ncbi:UMP-CMP kinase 3-like isoform X1 [Ananas comosus]|uniref:adenylate kinase n=1 Tax=Ananas comosus TaxID=4615 RepID=A0A6P5EH03_ANACO|nr:UMP-CMP kinase 3-like isoform X1 [Ananas comosus]XP_020082602.1 UMP-CMP kinase 3-like isoform X1 [Ananas comosus]
MGIIDCDNASISCTLNLNEDASEGTSNGVFCIFVLVFSGGPGSGKGTQCPKIVEHFGFTHLCAGDLLQAEVESGSENGKMIEQFKKEGKIVSSEVTVKLLQNAMQKSTTKKFVIDGFPRNEENRAAFENIVKIQPDFVLFFDCSQEELIRRLLNRNQGRVDDNIETISKRLRVYFDSTLPVIDYYSSRGKVHKIDAQRPVEEVFDDVKRVIYKHYSQKQGIKTFTLI